MLSNTIFFLGGAVFFIPEHYGSYRNKKRTFYLYTNIDAPNGRIVSVNLSRPNTWKDVVSETENVMFASSGGGYLFVRYLVDAKSQIMQYDLNGEIVQLGRLYGVPTPANAVVQRIGNTVARRSLKPGAYSVDDLLELIAQEGEDN